MREEKKELCKLQIVKVLLSEELHLWRVHSEIDVHVPVPSKYREREDYEAYSHNDRIERGDEPRDAAGLLRP